MIMHRHVFLQRSTSFKHPSARTRLGVAAAIAIALGLGSVGRIDAQEETKVTKTPRGGLLAKASPHQFEVFFYQTGVRLFAQNAAGQPVDISHASGTATFYHPNSPNPWFTRPLSVQAATAEVPQASLILAIGLSKVPPTGARATFEIVGLPDSGDSTVVTTVPVEFVTTTSSAPTLAAATSNPRYVYGPGYYGFGYYEYPGPQSAPVASNSPRVYSYRTPSSDRTQGGSHDWSTGRELPAGGLLSKPWLKPMD
jgi:hypothetical protein